MDRRHECEVMCDCFDSNNSINLIIQGRMAHLFDGLNVCDCRDVGHLLQDVLGGFVEAETFLQSGQFLDCEPLSLHVIVV